MMVKTPPWFLKMEPLNLDFSPWETPTNVTWEFGTGKSLFKLWFGLQTGSIQSMIHLNYTTPLFNKLQSFRGLLVDESMGIGSQEQNCEQQYQNVTHQSKKVILKQLKKNPNSSGSAKCASRNFLVPPQ